MVLKPSPFEGRFQRELDEWIGRRISQRIAIMCFCVLVVYLPYLAISSFCANLFTRDTVQLVELNPHLNPNFESGPEFQSIAEAEDWLLEQGYKYRIISTSGHGTWGGDLSSYDKNFPVKGRAGSLDESVIMMTVDYGDGELYELPFAESSEDSSIDFSRFEKSQVPELWVDGYDLAFTLNFASTHAFDRWFASRPAAFYDNTEDVESRERKVRNRAIAREFENQRILEDARKLGVLD